MVGFRLCVVLLFATALLSCATAGPSAPSDTCPTLPPKGSVVVNPGQTLRMNFSVPATSGTDVLQTDVSYAPNPLSGIAVLSCNLFNGETLLGSGPCRGNWQSSASPFSLPGIPVIDFSSIANGTILGRLDFAVSSGSWVFDLAGSVALARMSSPTSQPTVPNLTYVAAGTITSFTFVSNSCR